MEHLVEVFAIEEVGPVGIGLHAVIDENFQ